MCLCTVLVVGSNRRTAVCAEGRGRKTGKVCFDGRGERDGRRSLFKEALCGPDFLRLNVSAFIPVRSSSLLFFLGGNSPRETKHSLSALKAQLLLELYSMTSSGLDLLFIFFAELHLLCSCWKGFCWSAPSCGEPQYRHLTAWWGLCSRDLQGGIL